MGPGCITGDRRGLLIGMYCCRYRLLAWAFGRNHWQEEAGDGELLK